MDDRLASVERRLEAVTRELGDLRSRIETLEAREPVLDARPASAESTADTTPESAATAGDSPPTPRSGATVFHLGRSLMVLGGAYLLRAVTESAVVPPIAGAAAGLVYAAAWLYFCERASEAGQRESAGFHGVVALFIAYPLIWEACTTMALFSPAPGAAVLVSFFVLANAQGRHRSLKEVIWLNAGLCVAGALGLGVATRSPLPFTIALLVVGGLTEWSARSAETPQLRALAAFGLDVAIGGLLALSLQSDGATEGFADVPAAFVGLLAGGVAAVYVTSFALRTLRARESATPFDVAQTALAVALSFAAMLNAGHGGAVSQIVAGVLLLATGALTYATAFGVIDRISGRTLNFYVYMGFALVFALAGTLLALGATASAVAWCGMAGVALWLGGAFDRITLRFHGAAYLAGAVVASGLFGFAAEGLLAPAAGPWRTLGPLDAAVSLVASAGYAILARTRRREFSRLELVPQATVAAVLVWVYAGFGARALGLVLAHAPGPGADPALVAASRTVVLSLAAVALAGCAKRFALRDLAWFVYPVLVFEAFRLVLEDVRQGRPGSLFVSFAAYGAALVAVSRLSRKDANVKT